MFFMTESGSGSEMILHAGRHGTDSERVGGDGFYGHDPELRYAPDLIMPNNFITYCFLKFLKVKNL